MTEIREQLLEMLKAVATALGDDFRNRLVFVGGCTTALFITDPVTLEDVRSTDDIDLIVDLAGLHEWAMLLEDLRTKGFVEAADDDVICRMRLGRLKVDFMPDDEADWGRRPASLVLSSSSAAQSPITAHCSKWKRSGIF
jgi:hypothetical protein